MNRFSVMLFGLCVFFPGPLQAQESYTRDSRYWLTFGLGSSRFGPGFYGSVSYEHKNNLFSVRYLKGDEFRFNPGGAQYDEPQLTLKEVGILYGRSMTDKPVTMSLLAGVGYVQATDRGKLIEFNRYERIDISTIGVPFELSFRIESGVFGIGGSWAGNLNTRKFISAGVFQLSIGVF